MTYGPVTVEPRVQSRPRRSSADVRYNATFVFGRTVKEEADHDEESSDRKESEVPGQRICNIVADVMDGQDVMVHDSFDQVEGPPSDQQQASERAHWPRPRERSNARHSK